MRQMQPVLWAKGVALTPQHFQTQDRYFEDLVRFQLSALAFAPYGFRRVEIDREALAGGAFALSAGAGLMPDGLPFDFPGPDQSPAPRRLEGAWGPDQETLAVYLAVPERQPGGVNVSSGDRLTRWVVADAARRDENTGLAERPLQVGRKNLRLLLEGEAAEGSSALRVATLRRSPAGEPQLAPRFVPPSLDVAASDYLMAISRRLVEIMSAKSAALGGARRHRNQSLADFGLADVASFWLLYTVNTHLPALRHLFETRRGHPADLFEAMLALAGALSTFAPAWSPSRLPVYDHDDLGGCFTALDEAVRDMLETVVPESYVSLPMRQVAPSVHATALAEDRLLAAPQAFLAVSADVRAPDLAQRVPQVVKLAAADRLETIVRQGLPGVALQHTPVPPSAVPVRSNHQYYQLSMSGPEWELVRRARNLAAFVPAELPNAQLELVVVLPPRR